MTDGVRVTKDIPIRVLQVLAAFFVALKLAHLALTGTFMDEAYYWMWGQHPALSYFDHPPLNSWLLGLSASVFGWDRLALRLPVLLSFIGDIVALRLISRRVGGEDWKQHFWLTLVLFLATPMYFVVSGTALPDHLLLMNSLFALYFITGFFTDREKGEAGRNGDLYLGALFLGLAALSKYNAALLGIGVVIYIAMQHRALFQQGRLYLAGLLTLALQIPVIIWNVTEGYASWEFILFNRHAGIRTRGGDQLSLLAGAPAGLGVFAFNAVLFLSPFLLIGMARFLLAFRDRSAGQGFARAVFLLSTILFLLISLVTTTLFHWNLIAYVAALPFLVWYMKPRWLYWGQIAYGAILLCALLYNYSVAPLTNSRMRDESTNWTYGWDETVTAVRAAEAQYHPGFIAGPDYTVASLLGFAMRDRDVVSIARRTDAYDYWFDAAAHAGEDAILFGDNYRNIRSLEQKFDSIELLTSIKVTRFGRVLDTHRIYLAKGFKPNG